MSRLGALTGTMLALLLTACTGCGGDGARRIDWDLSRSHTARDVNWPDPTNDNVQIEPMGPVRIRLPHGQLLAPHEKVAYVLIDKHGDHVDYIQVDLTDRSTEDAYRVALRYAEQFGLDRKGLDLWYRKRLEGRRSGREELLDRAQAGGFEGRLGADGPEPIVQINYSADDARPSIVSIQFDWAHSSLG